jgi:hypothetical protein
MSASNRSKFLLPMVSALAMFALSAHAEDAAPAPAQPAPAPAAQPAPPPAAQTAPPPAAKTAVHTKKKGPSQGASRAARLPTRNFSGQPYRGRVAWEGGRWHHEVHNGRDGWWWDVGGAWYYYPEPMQGPPTYISEDYVDDVGPPIGYPPPPVAYAPPPPPPPPDPGASAVGGAIVGGLLGGLLSGRVEGAAIGAVAGGATGAIAGATATATSQPGYYLAQGNCYYRYPSGQYVLADPRACY